jgi:hypothetical protein
LFEEKFISFFLISKQWISKTNAIGLISKAGRYVGIYVLKDIAFVFASWMSVEFKLYLNELKSLLLTSKSQYFIYFF